MTSIWFTLSILGESVSIMFTVYQSWKGRNGYIFDVDHFNEVTKKRELRVRKCVKINENCETVNSTVSCIIFINFHKSIWQ